MVNGNIYNNTLPMAQTNYQYLCGYSGWWIFSKKIYCNANATLPEPPYLYLAESYENAYETAFEAEGNVSLNSKNYPSEIYYDRLPLGFINGTFGYAEIYSTAPQINYLINSLSNYDGQPYLFISTGSGGGNGYMYLNWIIATFGVPYEIVTP